jgi:DNA-binding Lrp family transcriptional regulator
MVLTIEEKERLVLDLYNRRTPILEIAKEAGMSFRDIGRIVDKEEKEKEAKKKHAQQTFASTQAYNLFLQGKTPVQVAIELNIREPEATQYYKEYWKLSQLHSLNWVYEQVKDDIGYFVKLYISAQVARIGVEQVVKLLGIANNDLPLVEHKYERLKREVDDIEADKHNSARILQEISDQITYLRKICKEQSLELTRLQMRKIILGGLVDNFQNNNEEYA